MLLIIGLILLLAGPWFAGQATVATIVLIGSLVLEIGPLLIVLAVAAFGGSAVKRNW